MKTSLLIKYTSMLLFFAIGISCNDDDNPEKQEDGIKIENMQTRLRIVEPNNVAPSDVENVWNANTKGILINYPPYLSYTGNTYFGYTDENGDTLLCKVINFPDSVKNGKVNLCMKRHWVLSQRSISK